MPFSFARATISGSSSPGSLPILPRIMPQASLSMEDQRGLSLSMLNRFISAMFFTYWLNGVTSGG